MGIMERCTDCQALVRVGLICTCKAKKVLMGKDYSNCPHCNDKIHIFDKHRCPVLETEGLKKTDLGNDRPVNLDLLTKLAGMPIYGEVLQMISAQQEKGLEKYGELLALENYSFSEWIEHAQMECIDKLLYLEGIKQKAAQLNKVIGNP